ncbi:MAG TPA: MarR family winged helix-turn-helix transcriptional regulator [Polyangiaceae bacterium]|nr:MarR family winged helix-turn-helix transcriptional regulator [Polyangiaceae bacterium]
MLPKTQSPDSDAGSIDPDDVDLERRLDELGALLRRLVQLMRVPDDRKRLRPTQLIVLAHLAERDSMRIGTLAEYLGAAQNTVSEVVSRLERAGLVLKERDADDNRAVRVRIGPTGRAALERQQQAARREQQIILEGLTPEQRRSFVKSFELMVSLVQRSREARQRPRETRRKR